MSTSTVSAILGIYVQVLVADAGRQQAADLEGGVEVPARPSPTVLVNQQGIRAAHRRRTGAGVPDVSAVGVTRIVKVLEPVPGNVDTSTMRTRS